MKFDNLAAFIDMGGYGFYVWLSFGVSLALLALLLLNSTLTHKKIKKEIARKIKREQKLKQAAKQYESTQASE